MSKQQMDTINNINQAISNAINSKKLDLTGLNIGDVGAQYLASNLQSLPNVTKIELGSNSITDLGFSYLLMALQSGHCLKLEKFDVGSNKIADNGVIQLAKTFQYGFHKTLKDINLQGNNISAKGAECLAEALQYAVYPNLEIVTCSSSQDKKVEVIIDKAVKALEVQRLKAVKQKAAEEEKSKSEKGGSDTNKDFTKILKVSKIEYDNPLLNHPELLKRLSDKYGSSVLNKLIDFGKQFASNEESRAELEAICDDESNFCHIVESIGCISIIEYHL